LAIFRGKFATLVDAAQPRGAQVVMCDASALSCGMYYTMLGARESSTGFECPFDTKKIAPPTIESALARPTTTASLPAKE
jgi:hypothetical protein